MGGIACRVPEVKARVHGEGGGFVGEETYHIESPALHAAGRELEIVILARLVLNIRVGLIQIHQTCSH